MKSNVPSPKDDNADFPRISAQSPFRAIRQKLFTEGKLVRYLGYAVGEVLLIIVGILFALKINDWNEDRKAQAEFNEYIVQLKEDVKAVIELANSRAEASERRAREGREILQVIQGAAEESFNVEAFESALGSLGRFAFVQIPYGNLNELLRGELDAVARDQQLERQVLAMVNDVKFSLSIINEKTSDLEIAKAVFIKYRGLDQAADGWEEFQGPTLRYDLNTLRTSVDFVLATHNAVQNFRTIRFYYISIAERLESFLAVLEEYE